MSWRELLQVRKIIPKTGEPASLFVPSFILADLPDAGAWTGHQVFVTDATPPNLATSDGTIWVAADDGAASA